MTYSQLRSQTDALCRKYATRLKLYRARPLASDFCDEMTDAVSGENPGPVLRIEEWAKILYDRLTQRRIRVKGFAGLYLYLDNCLNRRVLPQVNGVLRGLFPDAARRGLIPRPLNPIPMPERPTPPS